MAKGKEYGPDGRTENRITDKDSNVGYLIIKLGGPVPKFSSLFEIGLCCIPRQRDELNLPSGQLQELQSQSPSLWARPTNQEHILAEKIFL